MTWYKDLDGDQFGNTAYTRISCEAVDYYTARNDLDCDDSNSQINPDIDEDVVGVGDAIDDNCDDELTCYFDGDADGYGTGSLRTTASIHCEFPSQNISANDLDCDDSNDALSPESLWGTDADGDGYPGTDNPFVEQCTQPATVGAAYVLAVNPTDIDCDDLSASIYPSAPEIVGDDIDQNCDDEFDCYVDADFDGRGCGTVVSTAAYCFERGLSAQSGDCDDADPSIGVNAFEVPGDGIDQNCDDIEVCYLDSDGDTFGDVSLPVNMSLWGAQTTCATHQGTADYGDCDESNPARNPSVNARDYTCALMGSSDPFLDSPFIQYGPELSSFGWVIEDVGDIDGDGHTEALIAAPTFEDGTNGEVGGVYVYSGLPSVLSEAASSAKLQTTLVGENEDQAYGFEVGGLADWNSDGLADYFVATTGESSAADPTNGDPLFGGIYGYLGAASLPAAADYRFLFASPNDSDAFGEDVLISAIFGRNNSDMLIADTYTGVVYVVEHNTSLNGIYNVETIASVTLPITSRDDENINPSRFKPQLLASFENGSGRDGVALGDPYADDSQGEVLVFLNSLTNPSVTPLADQELSFPGQHSGGDRPHFGLQTLVQDVNGDFLPDLVVGAPGADDEDATGVSLEDRGAVYIYLADASGHFNATPDHTLLGSEEGANFGAALAITNLNGDHVAELVVSAPSIATVGLIPFDAILAGVTSTFDTLEPRAELSTDDSSATFGHHLTVTNDLDGDGYQELLIGGYEMDAEETLGTYSTTAVQGMFVAIPGRPIPHVTTN